jgi:HK97 family phage prohead protease
MQNRIYWGSDAPKNWKRAAVKTSSVPSVPIEFETSAAAPAMKAVRFIVSTDSVDRSNDTINQAGWDLSAFRKNPVVLAFHDASNWPVGKATKIGVEGGKLVAEVQFADTFEGRKAHALVQSGMLRATSVGFRPTESVPAKGMDRFGGYDFKKQELLEFSIVPVPANSECIICRSAQEEREERMAEMKAETERQAKLAREERKRYEARKRELNRGRRR